MTRISDHRKVDGDSRAAAFDWRREPDVDALLAEPIVRMMMARDGVSPQQVMRLVHHIRHAPVNTKR